MKSAAGSGLPLPHARSFGIPPSPKLYCRLSRSSMNMSEFSAMVTTKYLELFVFTSLRIDAALRDFLSRVELRGDSAERERLLRFFSARYHQSDPSLFKSVDEVHTLTCALLLLNSDLHGENLGKKMSIRDFINNIGHTGVQYKRDLLKALYNSIKEKEIVHARYVSNLNASLNSTFPSISSCEICCEFDPESQVEYKCGYIMRKCVYDADGAKTPFGRRGWREWYARLRGLALYLGRDDSDKKRSRYEMFNNAILLHHAFAEPAPDYKKKQYIFRLRTADLGEFLFQTTSVAEVEDWVNQINFVCARFSSRALPPPACSNGTFSRIRLPKLPSSAPLAQQLKAHESAACELREQLARVRQEAPPLKARGRPVEEFFFKERYLTQEVSLKRHFEPAKLSEPDPQRSRGQWSGPSTGVLPLTIQQSLYFRYNATIPTVSCYDPDYPVAAVSWAVLHLTPLLAFIPNQTLPKSLIK
ncbi:unnamed protein product [Haemonchus placei]|uniref:SEC7 domain-containing protein n=1 Tax=Haemonchus placei TaxID=6290 RepID=A0A0N4WE34_HAEPC|nr:unnamed protein product [Haemonchus placei]